MAARTPRRSFATPFVVTLAGTAACYVQSSPPPQGPPPSQPTTAQPTQPNQPPPGVMVNPPPPSTQPSTPPPTQKPPVVVANPPPPTTQGPTTPTQTNQTTKWTVYKAKDGSGCMAAIQVECVPKATCNPPPPFKYACPDNVSLDKPVTVVTRDGTSCFVEFPMPTCPPGTACNPPRPRPVACPKR
jgi:hypothetical protein